MEETRFCYKPSIEFISASKFNLKENSYNLKPSESEDKCQKLSLQSVAAAASTRKHSVMVIMKEIFMKAISLSASSSIQLDMKIGYLTIIEGNTLQFINY